ncbi:hypothetical protein [Desulfocapsa sulfexigens]|uniref:hypothetical protein n=1 Tax=Desulfocapsa sulfexigens TaxID=65555 RepID=UPI000349D7ED|nr:hypothetical protein [Desulfocapsa sulfexigens]
MQTNADEEGGYVLVQGRGGTVSCNMKVRKHQVVRRSQECSSESGAVFSAALLVVMISFLR